ncbi:MAG: YIP1 family protein [Bilophila wadsworthia]
MLIRCPECRFERQIDENAIPANAAMATCPHCQYRFRFATRRNARCRQTPAAAPAPQTAPAGRPASGFDGDDPLPLGAMVPVFRATMTSRRLPRSPKPSPKRASRPPAKRCGKRSTSGTISRRNATGKRGKGGIAAAMHVDGTDVPWEEPKRYNLMALYQTILRVMFNAPRFFAALPATNGKLTRPLVFYLILGMFQTLVERMWYLMSIQASGPSITDPKLQEVLGDVAQSMSLPLTILLTPGILAIQLCFFASVFYLMLRLVQPENVQFRTVFRVIAYSAAPTVVCIVPLVGPLVGSIWFGVCCFIGCKYSMRLPWSRTGLALGPLYLIAFAIGMQLIRQFLSMSA